MNQTKQEAAAQYVFNSEHTGGQRVIEIETAAFIAGAEWAKLKWIPVTAGPPKPINDENNTFCMVWMKDNTIELLSYNQHYGCWDDKHADDYHCDFDECKGYWPIPDSLLNFKP